MKRPRPQDARRDLRRYWSKVKVQSCADGSLHITPTWRRKYRRHGVITRMNAAYLAESLFDIGERS